MANKRERRSSVWNYFTTESVNGNSPRAVCKKCKQSFVYISSGNKYAGTSHLKRHLDRHIAHKPIRVGWKKVQTTKAAPLGVGVLSSSRIGVHEVSENSKERKGDIAHGEINPDVRRAAEIGFEFKNKGGQYLVNKLKSEVESNGSSNINVLRENQGSTGQSNLSFDQEGWSHEIAKMIIQHDYPLDIVENPRFINFAGILQPQYKIRSISIIEEQIARLYMTEKQNIFRILAGIPGRVSLALDLWSSDQSFGYVILTGQFLDCDWKLQRRFLSVVRLPFPDSEVAFNHAVASCITDWSVENKLFSLTLNENFSSEIVRGNLRSLLSFKSPQILDGQLIMGSCFARALGGVAQEALASMGEIVEKVRNNVKYVVASVAQGVKFDELRRKLQVPSTRDLEIDDQTKWNTTYEMLVAASELKELYFHLDTSVPDYIGTLSVEEWRQVETLTMYLKLLLDAASILHTGAYPTADLFFHEAWKVQVELMNGASSQDLFLSNLTKPLKEIFDTYWKDSSLILAVAVVMDPRFKMKFVELRFSEMYGDDAETWTTVIDGGLHELFLQYFEESLPPPPCTDKIGESVVNTERTIDDSMLSNCDDFLDLDFYIARIMGGPQTKSELEEYLEEPLFPHMQDFDVLDWWRLNRSKYPTLSRMASDILCIPVSTVLDQDSAFDLAERKMDRRRSNLTPSILEALICAKDWLQFQSPQFDYVSPPARIKMEY